MLIPRKTKWKKLQRNVVVAIKPNKIRNNIGRFALIAQTSTLLKAKTIEAVRRIFTKKFKRSGKVLVSVHCSKSVTKKPLESRMGKGKGNFSHWAAQIKKGQVLYRFDGVDYDLAKEAFLLASSKLPIKTQLFSR